MGMRSSIRSSRDQNFIPSLCEQIYVRPTKNRSQSTLMLRDLPTLTCRAESPPLPFEPAACDTSAGASA